jgi:serine/threonine-protein kinase 19
LQAKVAPFATRSQLYSVLADRTAVDRQLEELRRANAVRLLQLPASRDEQAVMLTADYCAALRQCQEAELPQGGGAEAGAAAAGQSSSVFGWFATRVLPACTEVMVTHAELVQLLAGGSTLPSTLQSAR